ncbi:hypothetical protein IQ250_01855 [Pseudanabaenaceae cyanobacterium LEGE 13415]|nr:hypothetical protein [Pseudanabaenaceae cyanobacterium LEGE 13415]
MPQRTQSAGHPGYVAIIKQQSFQLNFVSPIATQVEAVSKTMFCADE